MNKYNLLESFLYDQEDYIKFLVGLKERIIANDEGTCIASLKKHEDNFLYELTWLEDDKYIGAYIKPFKATMENILIFNNGCKIMAELLEIYIDTNDLSKVLNNSMPFGRLTAFIEGE